MALAISACLVAACDPSSEQQAPAPEAAKSPPLEVTLPAAPVTGEIPTELLDQIIDHLAHELGVPRDDMEVERAESVIWPDGALGCPRPDEMYTQAQVPGYWVVLQVGESRFDYRATAKGHFRRCSNSLKRQLPVG